MYNYKAITLSLHWFFFLFLLPFKFHIHYLLSFVNCRSRWHWIKIFTLNEMPLGFSWSVFAYLYLILAFVSNNAPSRHTDRNQYFSSYKLFLYQSYPNPYTFINIKFLSKKNIFFITQLKYMKNRTFSFKK